MSHLDAHTDNGDDEISASLHFVDGSFLFVHPDPARESERGPPGTYHYLKPNNATLERFARSPLPVVHMAAGELIVFEGFRHWHGCRYLKQGERRVGNGALSLLQWSVRVPKRHSSDSQRLRKF